MAKVYNYRFIGACLLVLGTIFYDAEAVLKTSFMEDLCLYQKTNFIDLKYQVTGILMSVPQFNTYGEFDCEVQLLPPKGDSVVLSIHKFDVDTNDKLTIEDSDRYMISLLGWGNFKDEKKAIISEGKMTIRYQRSNASETHPRSGFQFTYTKVKNSPCYDNEFKCQNGKCVPKDLVCDGHNHCGDGSGQNKCDTKETKNIYEDGYQQSSNSALVWVITISVAGLILLIVVVVFTVVLIRRSKANKANASNANPASSSGGNVPLQSVSSSAPHQPPVGGMQQPATVPPTTIPSGTPSAAPTVPANAPPTSFYDRFRRSVRGSTNPPQAVHHPQQAGAEPYQVPSMYPRLDQIPSAPDMYGVDNPDFKIEG